MCIDLNAVAIMVGIFLFNYILPIAIYWGSIVLRTYELGQTLVVLLVLKILVRLLLGCIILLIIRWSIMIFKNIYFFIDDL